MENGGTLSQSLSKLQIVGVMSVPPFRVTEPRRVRKVLVSDENTSTIHGCYQTVLYYEKLKEEEEEEEDYNWCLTGWIVESLSRVLLDHPLLAGRLQRRDVGDDIEFQIVSNDSGIRLLEARYPTTMSQFLELNDKEHLEADLVFWKEIDVQYPEFSPLFYIQVTSFECGGYSIGISCSLLVAEVLVVENFLKKWTEIHNKMSHKNEENETPIFNHRYLKNFESLPSEIITSTQSKNGVQSMVFKITAQDVNLSKEMWRELAMLCVEETEQKLGTNMASDFSLVVKESSFEVIKVETCSKKKRNAKGLSLIHQITRTTWNEFGEYEVTFNEGNKPIHVSCWIGSVASEHVMLLPLPCLEENARAVIVVSPSLF